jgi:hypothetical protein
MSWYLLGTPSKTTPANSRSKNPAVAGLGRNWEDPAIDRTHGLGYLELAAEGFGLQPRGSAISQVS